jgi:hypothetical protein
MYTISDYISTGIKIQRKPKGGSALEQAQLVPEKLILRASLNAQGRQA